MAELAGLVGRLPVRLAELHQVRVHLPEDRLETNAHRL
jgi:hypothetical protein